MFDEMLLGKLGCGSMSQSALQQELNCTFGELAEMIRRLSDGGRIHMQPDGSWCHVEHSLDSTRSLVTPPISFGNASMPTLTLLDIPHMASPRPEAPTRHVRLIAMV